MPKKVTGIDMRNQKRSPVNLMSRIWNSLQSESLITILIIMLLAIYFVIQAVNIAILTIPKEQDWYYATKMEKQTVYQDRILSKLCAGRNIDCGVASFNSLFIHDLSDTQSYIDTICNPVITGLICVPHVENNSGIGFYAKIVILGK